MKRRVFLCFVLLIVAIAFSGTVGSYSFEMVKAKTADDMDNDNQEKKRISEMTDEELKEFLSEYTKGYNYRNDSEKELMLRFMKKMIVQFDTPGKTYIPYNYVLYSVFAEEIDEGVRKYYGGDFEGCNSDTRYTPLQNSFVEIPANMGAFRCYGYAIGMYASMNPGFSNNTVLNLANETAFSLATYVKDDLQSSYFNQNCVKITTICPDYSSLAGRSAICIRKGYDSYSMTYDYHLMKLTSTGWLHKPGQSAIIKHLITHSPSTNWICEYTFDGVNWGKDDNLTYSGPIYYILYQANHTYQLSYTGNSYHSGHYHYYQKAYICTNCGSSYGAYYEKVPCSGPPCPEVINACPNDIE